MAKAKSSKNFLLYILLRLSNNKSTICNCSNRSFLDFAVSWPGERDSNPRRCYPQRFSRPPLSTTQPSPAFALNMEIWRRHPDSNWGIKALQAHALPLGYVATKSWCSKPDLNRHGSNIRGILSPLCLPIPPPEL